MNKKLSFNLKQNWNEQNANESIAYIKKQNMPITEGELESFRTGLIRGWNDAISTLKLHGYIEIDYKSGDL